MAIIGTVINWAVNSFRQSGRRNSGQQAASTGDRYPQTQVTVNETTSLAVSAVYAAVSRYSETISCMGLSLRNLNAQGVPISVNTEHDLSRLFASRPNRYQTTTQWLQVVVKQLRMHGNAYCLMQFARENDPRSRLVSLTPLMADQMSVELATNGDVIYTYTQDTSVTVLSEQRILHFKTMGNGITGDSPLACAAENVGLAISARDRASAFARNGYKPTAILTVDSLLDDDQRAAVKKNFSELTQSQNDSLHVLEAGFKYQSTSLSPADAQLLETRRWELEEIARFFNISPALIGDKGATGWGSDFEATMEAFFRLCLAPFCEIMESELSAKLLKPEERLKMRFYFNPEDLLKLVPGKLHVTIKEQVQGGLITPNEGREKLGMLRSENPAANELYMQQQMVKLGTGGAVPIQGTGGPNFGENSNGA